MLSKLGQPEDQKNQGKKDDESHVGLLSGENAEVIELNLRDWRSFLSKGSKSDTRSLQSMSWNAVVLSAAVLGRSILLRKVSMSQQCTVNDLEVCSLC